MVQLQVDLSSSCLFWLQELKAEKIRFISSSTFRISIHVHGIHIYVHTCMYTHACVSAWILVEQV